MSVTILEIFIRLLLSIILSGLIGFEREFTNKPAGFRTHILICIGSTTVMLCSIIMFEQYSPYTTIDPARLGAQVISGIGFLGAGTIIREGFNVKGLTTAASTWAVGCIGLAVGSGYYELSIISTLIVFSTLKIFGHIANKLHSYNEKYYFEFQYTEKFDLESLFNYFNTINATLIKFNNKHNYIELTLQFNNSSKYCKLLNKLLEDESITFINSIKV
ncbi:MAG: MgtC/SapB family protein [Eubacteriaceae bacterium]